MIPELGQVSLALAFCLALGITFFGLAGAALRRPVWLGALNSLVIGQFVFMALAFLALTQAFLTDDFSVAYVANNSNSLLPWYYKFSAVWGAHEGSFLLWVLIMAGWTLAVAVRGRHLPGDFLGRVLGVMGLLNIGFLAFLIWTSNPFERLVPMTPADGADLNPLLQDFGLIVHPPMLYMGYVGFSVAFAFAVAALLSGRLDATWARWSRPWSNVAWAFLTLGIGLGSWWAYYELGWGGWWFWDPVENASFMPWLAGTALIHSLAVTEKRGTFKSWTLLLAITTFSLSLLGAFIVRSGVLTSVHAFAVDPTRGLFILAFLVLVVGGSLLLYGLRATTMRSRVGYTLFSREAFLLVNNILLVVAMAVVLLGTLYPLAYEAATGGDKVSIGPPYFNRLFVPLMLLLSVALGLAPLVQWKRTRSDRLRRDLRWMVPGALAAGVGVPLVVSGAVPWQAAAAFGLAVWVLLAHAADLVRRARPGLRRVPLAYWGMSLAHVGFAVTLIGVSMTSVLSVEEDLRMSPGQTSELGYLSVRFDGVSNRQGPNFVAQRGDFLITEGNRQYRLYPEKRRYLARGNVMTEAAISPGLMRDVYMSLGEPLDNGDWAVRMQLKPYVRWIWLGSLIMALGGALAVLDARYRRLRQRFAAPAGAAPAPELSGTPLPGEAR
ncbi:MAG: heme lyase NrfEFG subunit NrfE [Gammaproteobacteria bacterium]|nr:heme lyase NrfEFG subunit NrfE [Gammaproteobacteria bacterium]|tara:strand:- start:1266 stop:3257 length:1992 start_codon:yes stop_codon:yes gene_type:complete